MAAAELASCLIHTEIKSNQAVRSYEHIWVKFRKTLYIEMRLWPYFLLLKAYARSLCDMYLE